MKQKITVVILISALINFSHAQLSSNNGREDRQNYVLEYETELDERPAKKKRILEQETDTENILQYETELDERPIKRNKISEEETDTEEDMRKNILQYETEID